MTRAVRNPIQEVGQGSACAACPPARPWVSGQPAEPPRTMGKAGHQTLPLPSVKPSTWDGSRKMQQSKYLVSHSSACEGTALPGAAVPPKFGAGSRPSKHCSSIKRWLLTHAASTHSPAHTSNVFPQRRGREKQLILQKHPSQSRLKCLAIAVVVLQKFAREEFSRDRAGLALKLMPKDLEHGEFFYLQHQPVLGLGSSSCCCQGGAGAGTADGGPGHRLTTGPKSLPMGRDQQTACVEVGSGYSHTQPALGMFYHRQQLAASQVHFNAAAVAAAALTLQEGKGMGPD